LVLKKKIKQHNFEKKKKKRLQKIFKGFYLFVPFKPSNLLKSNVAVPLCIILEERSEEQVTP
jgi:uncharacterized protein YcgL (UPF0745 family)